MKTKVDRHGKPVLDKNGDTVKVPARLFHDLRRSAVRNLILSGVSQKTAQTISGHKTDAIFKRYQIVTTDDQAVAFERMQAFLSNQPTEPKVANFSPKK